MYYVVFLDLNFWNISPEKLIIYCHLYFIVSSFTAFLLWFTCAEVPVEDVSSTSQHQTSECDFLQNS